MFDAGDVPVGKRQDMQGSVRTSNGDYSGDTAGAVDEAAAREHCRRSRGAQGGASGTTAVDKIEDIDTY